MKLKELQPCTHIRRSDRIIEFEKMNQRYFALCPHCHLPLVWDNWTKLHEPLRAKCKVCALTLPSIEINLESISPQEISHETPVHSSSNSL